ncbi:thioesterase [Sphingomonas oleivorans]|uniref:Thioesterase n=1 Tax=Sphingomonas oleivorans TaxID=1735121 RepID=A0A2T5G2Z9_9SPHN|nr:YbgC/FadM family acyl-CoA thioesterase [Sphingomonas oleivorans]PTQ13481.1 thioesterase [Sphingomonas oleivorans]
MSDLRDQPYRGHFQGGEHRFALRVYYEDTDAGGVVYHASYLRFMERARSDMLDVAGVDQRAALDGGLGQYVVAEAAIRYLRPARLHDALLVASRMTKIGGASCVIHQRVIRDSELLAEADITVAFLAPDGRPRRQPRAWAEIFERLKGES